MFDGYFFKLDSTLTKVWDVVIRGNAQTENDRYTRMVAVNDGSGYVACGSQQIIFDINGELVGGFQGWLTKISTEGDSLWNRYISFVDPDKNHTFYDLEETVDGGFLLCGEVKNLSAPVGEPVLAAWLVKVNTTVEFQFQDGSIKRNLLNFDSNYLPYFNSKMVRLKGRHLFDE